MIGLAKSDLRHDAFCHERPDLSRVHVPDDPVESMLSAIPAHFRKPDVIGNFYLISGIFPVE